jgi:alpha-glucosidase
MLDVARFWLDHGASGFRLDAIGCLYEDPALRDNPLRSDKKNSFGDPDMDDKYNAMACLPELHQTLRELRQVLDSYPGNPVLVGETSGNSVRQISDMFGKNLDEIQLPMNFFFADVNKLSVPDFRKQIAAWDANPAHGWPVYLFSNHDQWRHYVRYGDGKNNDQIAKLTAALMLTLRGTPLMYYGEEIGMENKNPTRVEDVKDPIGKIGWPNEKGRDGERTPMQWTADENAGFSNVKPWLPVTDNYKTHNVAVEENDPQSILSFYKAVIKLRKTNDALINGKYVALNETDNNVLSYLRKSSTGAVLVALNMSSSPQEVKFDLTPHKMAQRQVGTLLSTDPQAPSLVNLNSLKLAPYGVYIGELR